MLLYRLVHGVNQMNLTCKVFTIEAFKTFVDDLQFNGWTPNFTVVHNTSSPDTDLFNKWLDRRDWAPEQWLRNLASYYAGMGWNGCPHLFVMPNGLIGVLNDLTRPGTHSPSWNKFSWGVETVGEFEDENFTGVIRDTLIAALGILHSRIGLNPADFKLGVRGLHFHKEDVGTTHKTCPGKNVVKSSLIASVVEYMNANEGTHIHVTEAAQLAPNVGLTLVELTSTIWLQQRLSVYGFKVTADDKLGPKTIAAVREFQQKYRLKVDGIAGPKTRSILKQVPA